jgi:hypothetical protein
VLKQLLRVIEGFLVWFGDLIVRQEKVNIRRGVGEDYRQKWQRK